MPLPARKESVDRTILVGIPEAVDTGCFARIHEPLQVRVPLEEIPVDNLPVIEVREGVVLRGVSLSSFEVYLPFRFSKFRACEALRDWGLQEIAFDAPSGVLTIRVANREFKIYLGKDQFCTGGYFETDESDFCFGNEVRWLIGSLLVMDEESLERAEEKGVLFLDKSSGKMVIALPEKELYPDREQGEEAIEAWSLVCPASLVDFGERMSLNSLLKGGEGRLSPVAVILE